MCQTKPGLRCAAHLRKDYDRAAARFAEFDGLSDEVINHNEQTRRDFERARESMQFQQHRLDLLAIKKADASRAALARDKQRREQVRGLEAKLLTEKDEKHLNETIEKYEDAWQAHKAGKHSTVEQKLAYVVIEKQGKKAKARLAENAETVAAISKLEGQLLTATRTDNEQWVIDHEQHMLSSYEEDELAALRYEGELRNAAGLYLDSTRKPLPESYEQQVRVLRLIRREGLSTTHKDMEGMPVRVESIRAKQRAVTYALARAKRARDNGELTDPEQKPLQVAKADTAGRKPKRARPEKKAAETSDASAIKASTPAVAPQPSTAPPATPTPEQQAAEKRAEQMKRNRALLTAPAPQPQAPAQQQAPVPRQQATTPATPLIREGGERQSPVPARVATQQPAAAAPLIREGGERRSPATAKAAPARPSGFTPPPPFVERPAASPMPPASAPAAVDAEQPTALQRFLAFLQRGGQK